MEREEPENMSEDEFVERILHEIHAGVDMSSIDNGALTVCDGVDENLQLNENDGITKPKLKRRSNLTEFNDTQTTKRKNESAKRELTSIVNQLGKIDKQLNSENDPSRASINFMATFTSFKSNRVNTFKYPPDAEIKTTLLDYDTTMSAVKLAVKEAMNDFIPKKEGEGSVTSSNKSTEAFITPTKTISTFTAFPSPVTVKKILPTSSKNLCAKNSCTFGKKIRKSVWVKCSHRCEEGQSCNYCVHAPCIGFPNLKDDDVHLLNGWCCPDHTGMQMKRK